MAFYDEMADVSLELIEEFGRPLTLRRLTGSVPDPAKPWRATGGATNSDYPIIGIVQVMAPNLREGIKIERGDYITYIASKSLSVSVLLTDFIVDGGAVLSIQNVVEIKPGPTSLLFKAILRKWPPRSSS